MRDKLEALIAAHPVRWRKALRDARTMEWFADRLVEDHFTMNGMLQETTLDDEQPVLQRAVAIVRERVNQ